MTKLFNLLLAFLLFLTFGFVITSSVFINTTGWIIVMIISILIIYFLMTKKINYQQIFKYLLILLVIYQLLVLKVGEGILPYDMGLMFNRAHEDLSFYLTYNTNNQLLCFIITGMKYLVSFVTDDVIGLSSKIMCLGGIILNTTSCILINQSLTNKFNRNIGALAGIMLALVICFQPLFYIIYSDIYVLFTNVLIIYLLSTKIKFRYIYIGILLGITYLLKPSAIIIFIAYVILAILNLIKNKNLVYIKSSIIMFLTMFIPIISFNIFLNHQPHIVIEEGRGVKLTHFLSLGAFGDPNVRDSLHGTWNPIDAEITYDKNNDNVVEDNINMFLSRIKSRSLWENIKFYNYKHANNTDTGVFGYHRDGLWYGQTDDSPLYNIFDEKGKYRPYFNLVCQIFWVVIIFGSLLSLLIKDNNLQLYKLTLLGGLLFLIIFEAGGTKYLLQYLVYIVALSAVGFEKFRTYLLNKGSKSED